MSKFSLNYEISNSKRTNTMEECPICYCSHATCKLACGHSFCMTCVEAWYIKCPCDTSPTCPMCRKNIHFRGINKKIEVWEEQQQLDRFQTFFEEQFEEMLTHVDTLTMSWISFISERLLKIRDYDVYLSLDAIDYLVFNDYATIRILLTTNECDIAKKNILISKHPKYPVKKIKGSSAKGYRDFPEMDVLYIMV